MGDALQDLPAVVGLGRLPPVDSAEPVWRDGLSAQERFGLAPSRALTPPSRAHTPPSRALTPPPQASADSATYEADEASHRGDFQPITSHHVDDSKQPDDADDHDAAAALPRRGSGGEVGLECRLDEHSVQPPAARRAPRRVASRPSESS